MNDSQPSPHLAQTQNDDSSLTKQGPGDDLVSSDTLPSSPLTAGHQDSPEAHSPVRTPPHSSSERVMIDIDQSPDPTAIAELHQAHSHCQSTSQLDTPHQSPNRERSSSPAPSNFATAPSAVEKQLLQRSLDLYLSADQAASVDEESDLGSDVNASNADTSDAQLDAMANNPQNIRKELNENYMFVNVRLINKPENAKFKERVMKIVKSDRTSTVSEEDNKNFKNNYMTYSQDNEAAITAMLLPYVIKPQFSAQDVDDEGNPVGDITVRGWVEQGIVASTNCLFAPGRLPHALMNAPKATQSMIEKHFQESNALTTPKPDYAYGISENKLPQPPFDIAIPGEIKSLLNVAPKRDIFFVWENKSGQGDLMKCENQAIKATSAVIYAARQLLDHTGQVRTPGIDEDTYIFAATNNNNTLQIFVAYAWVPSDCSHVEFHMDSLMSVPFTINDVEDTPMTLANMRKPMHNIIEWGSITRMPALRRRYDKIYTFAREEFMRRVEVEEKAEASEAAEKAAKKRKRNGGSGK